MTDHEIDALVALRNPIDERALAALRLDGEELRLCEALMSLAPAAPAPAAMPAPAAPAATQPAQPAQPPQPPQPPQPAQPPQPPQPARRRRARRLPGPRPRLLAGFALAALAIVAVLALSGREPGSSGTAWAAPLVRLAESSPLLLLDMPGWEVTRADESDEVEGEMDFTNGAPPPIDQSVSEADRARVATLHWRRGRLERWQRSRAHESSLVVQRTVLGERAQVARYTNTDDYTAIWPDGERVLEFRSVAPDLATFERRLAALKRVSVDAWLSAMPASVIKSADRAGAVEAMLADIPLPRGFDRSALANAPTVSDRYQLAAKVTGAVACAWIERWADARERGDEAEASRAVAAMQTSHGWKILDEIESGGAWSEVLRSRADAMRSGGAGVKVALEVEVRSSLGCGRG
jgi:hypothetical protein